MVSPPEARPRSKETGKKIVVRKIFAHNLTRLARFSGREERSVFWAYAGCVIALRFLVMFAVMTLADAFARMQLFALERPHQANVTVGPGSYSVTIQGDHPGLIPDFSGFIVTTIISTFVAVCLLAAAVSRCLHDSGRTALWGLTPLPFLTVGFVLVQQLFKAMGQAPETRATAPFWWCS